MIKMCREYVITERIIANTEDKHKYRVCATILASPKYEKHVKEAFEYIEKLFEGQIAENVINDIYRIIGFGKKYSGYSDVVQFIRATFESFLEETPLNGKLLELVTIRDSEVVEHIRYKKAKEVNGGS